MRFISITPEGYILTTMHFSVLMWGIFPFY